MLLDQQNRARWDWLQIERGQQVLARALAIGGDQDPYVLQARIAACHAAARHADATDWPRIAALYTQLLQVQPSPVVALNRVVAILRSDPRCARNEPVGPQGQGREPDRKQEQLVDHQVWSGPLVRSRVE